MVETLTQARAQLDRLKSRLANVREETKHAAKMGTQSLVVVGGGALAGMIQAKYPMLPGASNTPTAGALGALLVAAAMSGVVEEQSDNLSLLGAGMLAAIAARETEKMLAA